jgi:hypothetical protein
MFNDTAFWLLFIAAIASMIFARMTYVHLKWG